MCLIFYFIQGPYFDEIDMVILCFHFIKQKKVPCIASDVQFLHYAARKHNFTTQWTLANSNKYNSAKVKMYSMLLLII